MCRQFRQFMLLLKGKLSLKIACNEGNEIEEERFKKGFQPLPMAQPSCSGGRGRRSLKGYSFTIIEEFWSQMLGKRVTKQIYGVKIEIEF